MSGLNVVKIENFDVNKLSLGTPNKNIYGSPIAPVLYDGKPRLLISINKKLHAPFSIQAKRVKGQKVDTTNTGKDFQNGAEMNLSFPAENYTEDIVYQKFQEIDQKFIQLIHDYGKWPEEQQEIAVELSKLTGKDDKGRLGKWKRLVKWPAKKDENDKLIYNNKYPPYLQVKVLSEVTTQTVNGVSEDKADFTAKGAQFYRENNEEIPEVTSDNLDEVLPPHSEVKPVLSLSTVSAGDFGFTVKPVLKQMKIYPRAGFQKPTTFLGDDDDEQTEADATTSGEKPDNSADVEDDEDDEDDEYQKVESDDEDEEAPKGKTVQVKSS